MNVFNEAAMKRAAQRRAIGEMREAITRALKTGALTQVHEDRRSPYHYVEGDRSGTRFRHAITITLVLPHE